MKTKLRTEPTKVLMVGIIYWLTILFTSCTTEGDKIDRSSEKEMEGNNRREVLLSFKNKLSMKMSATATKAETKAIATELENEISTLDIYVFGSKEESGTYTFRERFAYRQDGSVLPAGAKELNLTSGTDNAVTTALLELQKGLFVRLYCIANQTMLLNPIGANVVEDAYYQPLGFDFVTGNLSEGIPSESEFQKYHSPLLTSSSPALNLPLSMVGAQTVPIDLTDLNTSSRIQAGLKLTRTMARFDVSNKEEDSRFHIESVSMANGRRGVSFFPIHVCGDAEAKEGELITYPARAFNGDNANMGTQVSAFYSYPSPVEDGGYLILTGTYLVNETEKKEVSYKIPFKQEAAQGSSSFLEINPNHRYTISITKADEYHLDFTLDVAEWDDGGSIDEYQPGGEISAIKVEIPEAFKKEVEYVKEARTVSLSLKPGNYFNLIIESGSDLDLSRSYAGGPDVQQYDWLEVTKMPTTKASAVHTYKVAPKEGYDKDRCPRAVLYFTRVVDGTTETLIVTPKYTAPIVTSSLTPVLHAEANDEIPFVTVTGRCLGGSTLTCPDWLTFEETGTHTATTEATVFNYQLKLVPGKANFPTDLPGDEIITISNNQEKENLKTEITVSFSEDIRTEEITNFDESTSDGIRVGTNGKTLTLVAYSIFKAPTLTSTYNSKYCNSTNGGNSWLSSLNLIKTELVGNRRKHTFNIVVSPASGTDKDYQLHVADVHLNYGTTLVRAYTIWRGASYFSYPAGDGSPYYSALKIGDYWWAPVNVGAKHVALNGEADTNGIGNFYQWGRKDATNFGCTVTKGPISNPNPNNNIFYSVSGGNWLNTNNTSLWTSTGGSNNPCPDGWRIPSKSEIDAWAASKVKKEGQLLKVDSNTGFPQFVLPCTGFRWDNDGGKIKPGYGYYWTCTTEGNNSYNVYIDQSIAMAANPRARAYPVRCIRQ